MQSIVEVYYWEHGSVPTDRQQIEPSIRLMDPSIRPSPDTSITFKDEGSASAPGPYQDTPYDRNVRIRMSGPNGFTFDRWATIPCFRKGEYWDPVTLDVHQDGHADWVDNPVNLACLVASRAALYLDSLPTTARSKLLAGSSSLPVSRALFRYDDSPKNADPYVQSPYAAGLRCTFLRRQGRPWVAVDLPLEGRRYIFDLNNRNTKGNMSEVELPRP